MKKANKAMLLSVLVFPGLGHLYLRSYFTGALLAGAALACLYFVLSRVVDRATRIADEILSTGGGLDFASINAMLSKQSVADASTEVAVIGLGACWLIGAVGAYRLGRKKDKI